MSSPSSVFEGFDEAPSLGSVRPVRHGSMDSSSASSETSSEYVVENVDPDSFSPAGKHLDFQFAKKDVAGSETIVPSAEDTATSSKPEEGSTGNVPSYKVAVMKKLPHVENAEAGIHSSDAVAGEGLPSDGGNEETPEREVLSPESRLEEIQGAEVLSSEIGTEDMQGPGVSSPKSGTEEMQGHEVSSPEIGTEDMQGPGVSSPKSGTEEMQGHEVSSPEIGTEDMQGPGLPSSKRGTEEMQGHEVSSPVNGTEGLQRYEVLFPDIRPEEGPRSALEDGSSQQGEITEAISEDHTGMGTDHMESAPEETGEAANREVEEIEIPTEEFDSFRDEKEDSREEEVLTTGNGVEEVDIPEDVIEDFEDEATIQNSSIPENSSMRINDGKRPAQTFDGPLDEEDKYEATDAGSTLFSQTRRLQQNGLKVAETRVSNLQTAPEAVQSPPGEIRIPASGDLNEPRNRRVEAENQMIQLSSQLSLLQKRVEEAAELHEKSKNDSKLEHASIDKEQLSKQVSFFADKVHGLMQNIDVIQRILYREGGDLSVVEHRAKDLHSKCADLSAQLEHLGKQVSIMAKDLKHLLKLGVDTEGKLDKQVQEGQNVERQLTDMSKSLTFTVSSIEEEVAVGEFIEQQKLLLIETLQEAEKLRHIAEVRIGTLNKQMEQLELRLCDMAQNIQVVSKYQDKAWKYGFQTLIQVCMFAVGVITLYSRVREPFRGSIVPT